MPPPMIMAGMFTGGAIMPSMPAMAISAAALSPGSPMRASIGATTAPAVRTAALEEPVIMPGNMATKVRSMRRTEGTLWKRLITAVERASRPPDSLKAFMNTMAVAMVRIVSTKPKVPSTRWRIGIPSPPARAPATEARSIETETGHLRIKHPPMKTPTITRKIMNSEDT